MDHKQIVAESPLYVGEYKIIVLAEVTVSHWQCKERLYFWCFKKPVAVVIIVKNNIKILAVGGNPLPPDYLIKNMPELASTLTSDD